MNKESKLNLNAGDYAISHCDSDKTYTGLEVHKMLCDAYIAGSNDTLEDDDERIKNSLINLIKMSNEVGGFALHKWEANEMLTWIEKQSEHANFRNNIQVGDKVTRNEAGVLVNLSQLKRVAKPSEKQGEQKKDIMEDAILDGNEDGLIAETIRYKNEKQGEQKSTDTVEPKFKVGDKIYLKPEYRMPDDDTPIANTVKEIRRIDDKHYRFDGSYIFIEDQDKYELVEQKPEENNGNIGGISSNWSEEDEQHIDSLLKRLDALCRNKFERTRFAISEDRDWLKSLKPQNAYNPYKAVVESIAEMCKHYDKASHSGLRDFYDNVKVKCKEAQEYDKMFPQNHWKPSELQLGCLSDAIEYYNSSGYPAPKLKELLDDLKKLKEGKV